MCPFCLTLSLSQLRPESAYPLPTPLPHRSSERGAPAGPEAQQGGWAQGAQGQAYPQELRADPTFPQREQIKAERAQPEGCPQEPGHGLEVNGYGRRRGKEEGLETKNLVLIYQKSFL